MKKKFFTAMGLVSCSVLFGCSDNEAYVVGSDEEYAEIRTSKEEADAMAAKYAKGGGDAAPSRNDIQDMAKQAKASAEAARAAAASN